VHPPGHAAGREEGPRRIFDRRFRLPTKAQGMPDLMADLCSNRFCHDCERGQRKTEGEPDAGL
jgi:hypothetical protein